MLKESSKKITGAVRYLTAAIVTGVLVGGIDAVFGRVLLALSDFRTGHVWYLLPFLPVAGLVIVWLYHFFSEESLKGMGLVLETGQGKRGHIPLVLIPLVTVGTWMTHLFGGSAGREGVAVQIGAVAGHTLEDRFHISGNKKTMLITGMAAGFGGLFQTPLAAAFFAMEVITAGKMEYEAMLSAITASYAASFTSHWLGLEKFAVNIGAKLTISDRNVFAAIIIFGIIFGLTGRVFAGLLKWSKEKMSHIFVNPYARIGIVSIPLVILLAVLYQGRYCGLGTNLIAAAFDGQTVCYYDWIIKLLLTVLTLSIGFQGGEVTPLFSMGATLGIVLGGICGLPVEPCAALGYAAVFGSATNTLIAPILIGMEVFGTGNALAFVLVCAIAYAVNGNRSIYSAQNVLD